MLKELKWIMGMPITVCLVDEKASQKDIDDVFAYFDYVDEKFSTYKNESEISKINRGEIAPENWSDDMKIVFELSEKTKKETNGYFDISTPEKIYDPSGLVKGWSIWNAAKILDSRGYENFYIDAGGDIEARGKNERGSDWSVGIRNPFGKSRDEIIKKVFISGHGMATSGAYIRGQHIYNPHVGRAPLREVVSVSVIGPNIYEADRFATAAFAMGREGINFIEELDGFEGYAIDKNGIATMTTNFDQYL